MARELITGIAFAIATVEVIKVVQPGLDATLGRSLMETIATILGISALGILLTGAMLRGLPEIFATPVTGPIHRRSDVKDDGRGR